MKLYAFFAFAIAFVTLTSSSCSNEMSGPKGDGNMESSTKMITKTEAYTLYPAHKPTHTLVLYPGAGTDAAYTKNEFDIVQLANSEGISVLMMNVSQHLWLEEADSKELSESLIEALETNQLTSTHVVMGGMSIGGNMALTLSEHLIAEANPIQPKGVFVIDSPVDLYALYESALFDINNQDLDEERLAEPRFIIDMFESEFGEGSVIANIQRVSPFVYESGFTSVPHLRNCAVRFYIEPDADWWMENRQTIYENTNACVIQKVVKNLEEQGWRNVELIETVNKGYRSNGERHPHSWSIADMEEMVEWIVGME